MKTPWTANNIPSQQGRRVDGLLETKGDPAAAKIPAAAKDQAVAARLWEQSERLTGVTFASVNLTPVL